MKYTVQKHGDKVERVTLDGKDVTDRCYMADTTAGVVGLYWQDENGKYCLNPFGIKREELRGVVCVTLKRRKLPDIIKELIQ